MRAAIVVILLLVVACNRQANEREQPRANEPSLAPANDPPHADELAIPSADDHASAEPAPGVAAPSVEAATFGNVLAIGRRDASTIEALGLIAAQPVPRPDVAPLGTFEDHAGRWSLRLVRDVAATEPEVTLFGPDRSACAAHVDRAAIVHAAPARRDVDARTLLVLFFTGCEERAYGVVGRRELTRHEIAPASLPLAPRALVRLVRNRDEALAGVVEDESIDPFRALVLPEHDLAIVVGHVRWIVRDGRLLRDRFHGRPVAAWTAGNDVLLEMDSISEGWVTSARDLVPNE